MPLDAVLGRSRLLHHGRLHKHAVFHLRMHLRVRVGERGGARGLGVLRRHGLEVGRLGNGLAPLLHGGSVLGGGVVVSSSAHGEGCLLRLLHGRGGIGRRGDDVGVGG